MTDVWLAVDDLGYSGEIIIGAAAAADPGTGKAMCESFTGEALRAWWEDADGNWSAQAADSTERRYTVTRYPVQTAAGLAATPSGGDAAPGPLPAGETP